MFYCTETYLLLLVNIWFNIDFIKNNEMSDVTQNVELCSNLNFYKRYYSEFKFKDKKCLFFICLINYKVNEVDLKENIENSNSERINKNRKNSESLKCQ